MTRSASLAQQAGSGAGRLARAWRSLPPDRKLAASAAVGLFFTLFLPWYQETVITKGATAATALQSTGVALTGWAAFSFVEAAVLLVSVGVLTLLFQRAEGRAFHLPGGDGSVIMAAGLWTCVLIVWRTFDKQGASVPGQYATASGIEWGIFVALAVAALLAYSGSRIRAAHQPEPPLPGDDGPPEPWDATPPRPSRRGRPPRPVAADRSPATITARDQRSRAAGEDRPTRVSNRRPPDADATKESRPRSAGESRRARPPEVDRPTRVSSRRPPDADADATKESPTRVPRERSTRPFGPPVVPDDPPTLRLGNERSEATDEHLTTPLDGIDPDDS